MKITKVEPLLLDRFLYVRVYTDSGIVGIGESGTWGQLEASAASIAKYGDYLVGKDPFPIEHHWNVMLRANHFTGGAITGAVSAIDIALWDIKGKFFNVPVFELLGGKVRHKARLYGHVKGRTIEKLVEEAVRLKNAGFTALGHLNPLLDESEHEPYYKSHAAKIEGAIDNVRRLREAVGPTVDLCIEIHRRLTPPEAIALARGIEKYTPMFYEDPLRPNSFDAMAQVARHIDIPIATGERFTSLYQFQTLLTRDAVQYLRPDVCLCGGITGAKKIAALAEAHDAWIVPHNPLSPGCPSRSTASSPFPTLQGSGSSLCRMWKRNSPTVRGRFRCGRMSMGRWSISKVHSIPLSWQAQRRNLHQCWTGRLLRPRWQ